MIIEEHEGMKIFKNSSESATPKDIKMIVISEDNLPEFFMYIEVLLLTYMIIIL